MKLLPPAAVLEVYAGPPIHSTFPLWRRPTIIKIIQLNHVMSSVLIIIIIIVIVIVINIIVIIIVIIVVASFTQSDAGGEPRSDFWIIAIVMSTQ